MLRGFIAHRPESEANGVERHVRTAMRRPTFRLDFDELRCERHRQPKCHRGFGGLRCVPHRKPTCRRDSGERQYVPRHRPNYRSGSGGLLCVRRRRPKCHQDSDVRLCVHHHKPTCHRDSGALQCDLCMIFQFSLRTLSTERGGSSNAAFSGLSAVLLCYKQVRLSLNSSILTTLTGKPSALATNFDFLYVASSSVT